MEVHWLIHIIIMLGLGIATVTDIKKREVPDWLNFGLIILGILLGGILSIINNSWHHIIASVIGFGIGYGVGAIMFYTGQWGGGDAKMLMGMGAIIGVPISASSGLGLGIVDLFSTQGGIPFFLTVIITIFIAGGIYGLFYTFGLIIKNWAQFKIEFKKKREEKAMLKLRKIILGIVALLIVSMLIVNDQFLRLSLGLLAVFIFFGQYLIIISKVIEKVCMIKTIPIRKLTEGDWIVKDIVVKGERICGPKDLGVSLEQIGILKKKKVRTIEIKEGIPFIPGFLLGYILMLIFGNWIVFLIV